MLTMRVLPSSLRQSPTSTLTSAATPFSLSRAPLPFLTRLQPPHANSSPLPSIFLTHLTGDPQHHLQDSTLPRESQHDIVEEEEEEDDDDDDDDDDDPDPIRNFFESLSPKPDPPLQGRVTNKKNRRTAWHLAPDTHFRRMVEDDDDSHPYPQSEESHSDTRLAESFDKDNDDPHRQLHQGGHPEPKGPILDKEVDGVVAEVMRIVRNLAENATLSEVMGAFEGRVGEGESIELLKKLGDEGHVQSCLYLWEWMGLQRPMLLSSRACSVLFPVLGKVGMGEELVVLFQNLPRERQFMDVHVYNAAIAGLSRCGRYKDAWDIYEAMGKDNVMPNQVTCSTLISIMRKSGGSAKDAWQFFEKMNKRGVEWGLEIMGALIKSFCDEDLKKEALIIQTEMEERGIASNVIIYNTLMDAYVKSDQIEEAEALFNEIKRKGLAPTTVTYNVLIDAYSRRMQPEVIEDLLEEMKASGLKPDVKSYTGLISAYGRQRKMSDMAANAFLRMKKAGIKPTSHSYTALIHSYSVGGWHEKALAAFEDMKRREIHPSIETYTALLDAFRRAGDANMLMKIWKAMAIDKIEGTRITFNILVDGLAKQGMYVQARDVVHEFGKLGMPPTVMTYNMLMNAYARGGQHNRLPQLLKEMEALTLKPDSVTYLTMIYAYIRVRDFKRAFIYHKEMVRSGQVPDARSYQKLRAIIDIKAAAKNKSDKRAILGIVNSTMGLSKVKGKKDEFWKNRKTRSARRVNPLRD